MFQLRLTPRERDVLHLLTSGKADKEIALALGVTTRTVRYHISNLFRKANVFTRAELIVKTLGAGTDVIHRTADDNKL